MTTAKLDPGALFVVAGRVYIDSQTLHNLAATHPVLPRPDGYRVLVPGGGAMHCATAPDRPAANAKGTVSPSAVPMTRSRTTSFWVKCFSSCGGPGGMGHSPSRVGTASVAAGAESCGAIGTRLGSVDIYRQAMMPAAMRMAAL